MARMLINIPTMYEKEEIRNTLGQIPNDFKKIHSEFWNYIEGKLNPFVGKIRFVYSDRLNPEEEGESRSTALLKKLIEGHAEFHCVEDYLLAAEAEAWLEMLEAGSAQAARELYEENLAERDGHAKDVVAQTLKDGEIGVLFVAPARKIMFPPDIKVVKMCPFDPVDYLNRHLVKLNINRREGKTP